MLGEQIRRLRLQRGMTGSELARRTGVSRSLISQIERGTSSPSVGVLRRLSAALEIQIGFLFNGAPVDALAPDGDPLQWPVQARPAESSLPRVRVVQKTTRKTLSLPRSQVRYELLSPDLQGRLEFVEMVIQPGDATPEIGFTHEGEESIVILQGTARFHYGDQVFLLEEGDTITFDSAVPHVLTNVGKTTLVAISAGTPPSF